MTGSRRYPKGLWIFVAVLMVAGAAYCIRLVSDKQATEAVDNSRSAATKPVEYAPPRKMTRDMAVSFIQAEYPGRFPNTAKLFELIDANCAVAREDGWQSAIYGLLSAGFTHEQAAYVMNMSAYSTCPEQLPN